MTLFSSIGAKYRHLIGLLLLMPLFLSGQLVSSPNLQVGAERPGAYLPLLHGKKTAVVANQTSRVGEQHLVDYLLEQDVSITKVFAPEHGFRGKASAGARIQDGRDSRTGLAIVSLYGSHKKPSPRDLENVEIILFDIQDVGVRFYTYISTLSLVMEAAAEKDIPVVVLDRPNPNGHYVDGPVLKPDYASFVGMHPIPIVHGLTVGEYATMVNQEGWLPRALRCDLSVVECQNYSHDTHYDLPVAPSPNLPNRAAVLLYPSLALFEGTTVSVGRGTARPFQIFGAPYFTESDTTFVPQSRPGARKPKHQSQACKGFQVGEFAHFYLEGAGELYLYWLQGALEMAPDRQRFFTDYFDKLAGNSSLRQQLLEGVSISKIRKSWDPELKNYRQLRRRYLRYPLTSSSSR